MDDGFTLIPGVTRWVTRNGERIQQSMWDHKDKDEIRWRDLEKISPKKAWVNQVETQTGAALTEKEKKLLEAMYIGPPA